MGIFGAPFAYRRLLTELRGIRRALERQADVLELQAGAAPRSGGQSFRSFAHTADPHAAKDTSVSYVNEGEMGELLKRAEDLTALLGRSPTDLELEAAFRGDIEP